MQFSTKERDNDLSSVNCAVRHKGGWWYNQCSWANLNGVYYGGEYSSQYGDGVKWVTLRGQFYSFKRTEMKGFIILVLGDHELRESGTSCNTCAPKRGSAL